MSGSVATHSPGVQVRRTAIDVVVRIDSEGAYANLALGPALKRSGLAERDRAFVTDLVYGTTRMQRACDHLIARHRDGGMSDRVRGALRVGAYQLAFAGIAAHAAVDATVGASPRPARGLVNAVLRRIAEDVAAGLDWPDDATRLSYPDWIVDEVTAILGESDGLAALEAMNRPATTHVRDDGYVQDLASQAVVHSVGAAGGDLVLDMCAAPGGKATGIASTGARVIATDTSATRAGLVVDNSDRLGLDLPVAAADGTRAPFPSERFDRVLVDAPCSGLGVLRRRADARWRIDRDAPTRLAALQRSLLDEAFRVVRPGGSVIYAVCTLTRAENGEVADAISGRSDVEETGRRTLVPDEDHDGMFICTWTKAG